MSIDDSRAAKSLSQLPGAPTSIRDDNSPDPAARSYRCPCPPKKRRPVSSHLDPREYCPTCLTIFPGVEGVA